MSYLTSYEVYMRRKFLDLTRTLIFNSAYIVNRAYILYMRVAQYAFLFTLAGPTHFARISKITTRQIRNVNVCKYCE